MVPALESLEPRAAPSALGAALPQLVRNLEYDSAQVQTMHHYMHVYWDLMSQDIAKGNDPGGAAENVYGAATAFFSEQSFWASGQVNVSVDRFLILVGLASGQFDDGDGSAVWSTWNKISQLDHQNNISYSEDLALFSTPFPYGYEFPIPGIHGATSLSAVYPGLNS